MRGPGYDCYNGAVTESEAAWRRSSRCGSTTCIEISRDGGDYLIRDSKNPEVPPLRFGHGEWVAFLDRIQYGDLNVI